MVLASDPNFAHLGERVNKMIESKKRKRPSTSQSGQQPSQNGGVAPTISH
jgi:hypothetical protein